jgi:DegV family protein with EDD domain
LFASRSRRQFGIEVVPLRLVYEGKVHKDGLDANPEQIYHILPEARNLPTTSAPSPGDCCEILEAVAQKHSSILVITISARFSTTFDSATVAVKMAEEQLRNVAIEVLDCGTAAGAQGLIVLAAARAAGAGRSLAEVTEVARKVMSEANLVAFLDTLYYLAKGGRVPKAVAWANSLIKLEPIFQIAPLSGELSIVKIARTRQGAIKQLLGIVRAKAKRKPIHTIVMHNQSLDEAQDLKQRLVSQLHCDEAYISDFTPAMGIHTAPGVLGIAFYAED